MTEHIQDQAEKFQDECHKMVKVLRDNLDIQGKGQNTTYQDLTNVWMFKKLAEFELRLQELESEQLNRTDTPLC